MHDPIHEHADHYGIEEKNSKFIFENPIFESYDCLSAKEGILENYHCNQFLNKALKGSGVLSSPEQAGGRQGRQAPLTLSRP